jgi:Tfp pilus assembly protein PilV
MFGLKNILGEMKKSHRVRIGYYSQHSAEQLDLNKSPAEYLVSKVTFSQITRFYMMNTNVESSKHSNPMSHDRKLSTRAIARHSKLIYERRVLRDGCLMIAVVEP